MGPGLVGPELLAGFAGRTSVGVLPLVRFLCPSAMSAFLLLSPSTMYQYGIINAIGSHQDGSTCPSPGDKDAHDTQYDLEEEAMRRDGLAEELKNKNEGEVEVETKIEGPALDNYETPQQGIGSEATTIPTSAERVYGLWAGNGGVMTMAGEERRSITDKIDKYSEFDRRSAQTIAVEEMAIQNEPTRSVLTQLFRLDGQTGHLQAYQAERAEEFEKESEYGYLTDKLSHEMKAKKNSVSTMRAKHEKQIEAINIDNIFIPEYQPGGLRRDEEETLGIETRDQ